MRVRGPVAALLAAALLLAGQAATRAEGGLPGGLGGLGGLEQLQPEQTNFIVSAAVEPAEQAPDGRVLAKLSVKVAAEHYVWRKGLVVELLSGAPAGVTAGEPVLPASKQKYDKYAKETVDYYDGTFTVTLPLELAADVAPGDYDLTFRARYTGCGPDLCSFRRDTASAHLRVVAGAKPTPVEMPTAAPPAPAPTVPAAVHGAGASGFEGKGLLGVLLAAFAGGLLLAFTPCVYPLIPITISLVGATAGRRRLDGFIRSAIYVFGISITYSVAGVVAAAGGAQFGAWLQQPAVYIALAVLFVLLAGAMFEAYSIDLSSQRLQRLQVRLQGKGGLLGIWLIGVLSGAAATACIAPVVVGVLLYVGQRGSLLVGSLVFFAMAWGMGTPLVVLGTFTGLAQALPKSGEWLNTVKRAFGLALLGVALYYVGKSRLVPDYYFRLVEGAFLLVAGVFVGAFDLLTARSGWWPRLRKAAGLLLVTAAVAAFLQPAMARKPAAEPVQWVDSEAQALAQGKAEGKPVLLDFWADWCPPCHEMFEKTYVDPRVVAESGRFVMARVDMTDFSEEQQIDLRKRYAVMAAPTTVLIGTDGAGRSVAGYVGPGEMLALMRSVK